MDNMQITSYEESQALVVQAAKFLQPRTPITTRELFAGRWNELTTVADAVNQAGLHAVIYGERGVGKTSLANVIKPTIWALDSYGKENQVVPQRLVIKTVASSGDTFSLIWQKLFKDLNWTNNQPTIGLLPTTKGQLSIVEAFGLPDTLGVDDVRRVLAAIPHAVFIIDEFDRTAKRTSRDFTDLIKALCDSGIDCTLVLVGVSSTIDQLVSDHASIGRAITQIFLRRMGPQELREILRNAEKALSIKFSEEAADLIVHVSQGLPHYTHLVGLCAVRAAVSTRFSKYIERADVFTALREAVKQAEQTASDKHSKAIHSAHKGALYRHVLLACALTAAKSSAPLGYFTPGMIVEPLSAILSRKVEIATFSNHLSEFCEERRGSVLQRDGQPRGYRFRFEDPMIVPFVFMDAVTTGIITESQLSEMLYSNPSLSL